MMTAIAFFRTLLFLLVDVNKYKATADCLAFYSWLFRLQMATLSPGDSYRDKALRMGRYKSALKQMPRLGEEFYDVLDNVEDLYSLKKSRITELEFQLLSIKRFNVRSFIAYLKGVKTDNEIKWLRPVLFDAPVRTPRKQRERRRI